MRLRHVNENVSLLPVGYCGQNVCFGFTQIFIPFVGESVSKEIHAGTILVLR